MVINLPDNPLEIMWFFFHEKHISTHRFIFAEILGIQGHTLIHGPLVLRVPASYLNVSLNFE